MSGVKMWVFRDRIKRRGVGCGWGIREVSAGSGV